MAYKPGKWPHYALENWEKTVDALKAIQSMTKEAQVLMRENRPLEAVVVMGDVRDLANAGLIHMIEARSGQYSEREGIGA